MRRRTDPVTVPLPIDRQHSKLPRSASQDVLKGRDALRRRQEADAEFTEPVGEVCRSADLTPGPPIYADGRQSQRPPLPRKLIEISIGGGMVGLPAATKDCRDGREQNEPVERIAAGQAIEKGRTFDLRCQYLLKRLHILP